MTEVLTYTAPKVHCNHCALTIKEEVGELADVADVEVDLDATLASVRATTSPTRRFARSSPRSGIQRYNRWRFTKTRSG